MEVTDGQQIGTAQIEELTLDSDERCDAADAQEEAVCLSNSEEAHHCDSVESIDEHRAAGESFPVDSISHLTADEVEPFVSSLEQCTLMEDDLKKALDGLSLKAGLDNEVGHVEKDSSRVESDEELEHNLSTVLSDMDRENGTSGVMLDENLPPECALITSDGSPQLNDMPSEEQDLKPSNVSSAAVVAESSNVGFEEDVEPGNVSAENEGDVKELMDSASTDKNLQNSGDFQGVPSMVESVTEEVSPPSTPIPREEDVTAESWRTRRRHVFVLSEAGKPIYSRYGNEEALSSTMGVMMALVSFVKSGNNSIRSIHSGR